MAKDFHPIICLNYIAPLHQYCIQLNEKVASLALLLHSSRKCFWRKAKFKVIFETKNQFFVALPVGRWEGIAPCLKT